ncbi:hypothetical protein VTO42DRAFT_123 [Malbranchea cinnamomea]
MASSSAAKETAEDHPAHLDPSELGTKEYWESFYESSLSHLSSKKKPRRDEPRQNNEDEEDEAAAEEDAQYSGSDSDSDSEIDDEDDPGTSWFSEYKAPEKVLRFLTSDSFPLAPCNTSSASTQPSILDLGTGNGSMLTLLRDKGGFTGSMVGLDYSEKSIELARQLLTLRSQTQNRPNHDDINGDNHNNIRFEVWDILATSTAKDAMPEWFPASQGGFDIVLDKGTFDAVSLSAEEIAEEDSGEGGGQSTSKRVHRRICERYPAAATRLVRPGGFLVVTSCNWTEDELVKWFTAPTTSGGEAGESALVVWGRIEYAKFRFGGQEGQGVCTVCFQRNQAQE